MGEKSIKNYSKRRLKATFLYSTSGEASLRSLVVPGGVPDGCANVVQLNFF